MQIAVIGPEVSVSLALWEQINDRHKVWGSLENKQSKKSEATLKMTLFAVEQT